MLTAFRSRLGWSGHLLGLRTTKALGPESECCYVRMEGNPSGSLSIILTETMLQICKSDRAGKAVMVVGSGEGILAQSQKSPLTHQAWGV